MPMERTGIRPIRVLLADRQAIMREGLRIAFERAGGILILAEAEDEAALTLMLRHVQPDILVLDAGLIAQMDADFVSQILVQAPLMRLLIGVSPGEDAELPGMQKTGRISLISRMASSSAYHAALLALARGRRLRSAVFLPQRRPSSATLFGLTEREKEILGLICSGYSNKDVARLLDLSVRTVETHRLNIRRKTRAVRLRDLLQVAHQLGLGEAKGYGARYTTYVS